LHRQRIRQVDKIRYKFAFGVVENAVSESRDHFAGVALFECPAQAHIPVADGVDRFSVCNFTGLERGIGDLPCSFSERSHYIFSLWVLYLPKNLLLDARTTSSGVIKMRRLAAGCFSISAISKSMTWAAMVSIG